MFCKLFKTERTKLCFILGAGVFATIAGLLQIPIPELRNNSELHLLAHFSELQVCPAIPILQKHYFPNRFNSTTKLQSILCDKQHFKMTDAKRLVEKFYSELSDARTAEALKGLVHKYYAPDVV